MSETLESLQNSYNKATHHGKVNPMECKTNINILLQPIDQSGLLLSKVKCLNEKVPIEEAFDLILEQLSAPLFNTIKNQYVGIIDLKHFLNYILFKLPFPQTGNYVKQSLLDLQCFPFHTLSHDSNVLSLFKYFETGVHRAFILDKNNELKMISQIDLIHWLKSNISQFPELADKDLLHLSKFYELKSISKVHKINFNEPVFRAFQDIHKYNIYGMPIVNDQDIIVGNISIHDLKNAKENLDKLALPLNLYFMERPIFTCDKNTKLPELFNMFDDHHIHRVHFVENNHPVGVVTITDVISMIYNYIVKNHLESKPVVAEM
ncbi:hypothetical protein DLAC_00187 [Tieghemostelium lacteum]|uniref:CBS domain-containing protein n=1 Tax=Tieghemostelium lacteum TaxID=361077 RepID=A0A152A923_TIELA|nr:hypothetical protein DLAC_00187 [Tieghemostelium lacteum]|eukprot:KYR02723.1 hypothetical protein DLAC_00187 [Tieghemostelium lacteum]